MKKFIIISMGLLLSAGLFAQTDTIKPNPPIPPVPPVPEIAPLPTDKDIGNDDTIKIKVGNYKVIVIDNEKKKKSDEDSFTIDLNKEFEDDFEFDKDHKSYKSWAGFDFGVNGYLTSDNSTQMPAGYDFLELNYRRSFSFGLNLFEKDIPIVREYVKLAGGLGMEWNNYVFMNNVRLVSDSTSIYGINDTIKYDKSRLLLTYINLPLLIQFNTNTNPDKAFHFTFGAILSYDVGAATKLVYEVNNKRSKLESRADYHVNPFRYGLTARVGYGNYLRIFANYSLNSLFVKDEGPELYPFTVGICVIPF